MLARAAVSVGIEVTRLPSPEPSWLDDCFLRAAHSHADSPSSTGQQPPLTYSNTNAVCCLVDTRRFALKGSAPKRKAVVRLHALSFYTPTVIGLFY